MRIFKINDRISINCSYAKGVRDGFTHIAALYIDNILVGKVKVHYINRTWESYEFQSVMQKLIRKTKSLTPQEKAICNSYINKDNTDWGQFRTIGTIAQMGELFGKTPKEKNTWKERMLKTGLSGRGLEFPSNWNKVNEKTKGERLNKVIDIMLGFKSKKEKQSKR